MGRRTSAELEAREHARMSKYKRGREDRKRRVRSLHARGGVLIHAQQWTRGRSHARFTRQLRASRERLAHAPPTTRSSDSNDRARQHSCESRGGGPTVCQGHNPQTSLMQHARPEAGEQVGLQGASGLISISTRHPPSGRHRPLRPPHPRRRASRRETRASPHPRMRTTSCRSGRWSPRDEESRGVSATEAQGREG